MYCVDHFNPFPCFTAICRAYNEWMFYQEHFHCILSLPEKSIRERYNSATKLLLMLLMLTIMMMESEKDDVKLILPSSSSFLKRPFDIFLISLAWLQVGYMYVSVCCCYVMGNPYNSLHFLPLFPIFAPSESFLFQITRAQQQSKRQHKLFTIKRRCGQKRSAK